MMVTATPAVAPATCPAKHTRPHTCPCSVLLSRQFAKEVQCLHLRAGAPEPRRTRRGKGLGIGGMPGRSRPPGEAGWGVFLNTRVVESGGQGNGGVQGLWNWIAYNWPSNAVSPSCPASLALVLIVWCVLSCGGSSVCVRSSPARSAIRGAVRDVLPSGEGARSVRPTLPIPVCYNSGSLLRTHKLLQNKVGSALWTIF